jgi:hypothetical protein
MEDDMKQLYAAERDDGAVHPAIAAWGKRTAVRGYARS